MPLGWRRGRKCCFNFSELEERGFSDWFADVDT
jgi:hypothetical protein